jgi:hypothetical protein
MIVVVGTAASTYVKIKPTAPIDVGDGATFRPEDGSAYEAFLYEGDVLQVFSLEAKGDLTGTSIESDFPVAVFSGNIFTTYGKPLSGWNGPDLAIEQVPPHETWGEEYVGAFQAPQRGCDSLWGQSGRSLWQVVAATDDTMVTLVPSPGTVFDLDGKPYDGKPLLLDKGESRRFFALPGPTSGPPDFVASANRKHRILLAQWMDCEPALSFGIDTRFGSEETDLVFPLGFDHEVLIVRKEGMSVVIDAEGELPETHFGPVFGGGPAPGSGFQVARLPTLGATCVGETALKCFHKFVGFKGSNFGVSWRGMDVACSYAVTVPTGDRCVLLGALCQPDN